MSPSGGPAIDPPPFSSCEGAGAAIHGGAVKAEMFSEPPPLGLEGVGEGIIEGPCGSAKRNDELKVAVIRRSATLIGTSDRFASVVVLVSGTHPPPLVGSTMRLLVAYRSEH